MTQKQLFGHTGSQIAAMSRSCVSWPTGTFDKIKRSYVIEETRCTKAELSLLVNTCFAACLQCAELFVSLADLAFDGPGKTLELQAHSRVRIQTSLSAKLG